MTGALVASDAFAKSIVHPFSGDDEMVEVTHNASNTVIEAYKQQLKATKTFGEIVVESRYTLRVRYNETMTAEAAVAYFNGFVAGFRTANPVVPRD